MAKNKADKGTRSEGLMGGFLQKGTGSPNGGIQIRARADELTVTPELEHKPNLGKGRKTLLAAFGLQIEKLLDGDPDFLIALEKADKYRKVRMKELAHLHGHVSAGAGAMLASASLALATSRYLYERAARNGNTDLLAQASKEAEKHRQTELAAWEMSAREGQLKRRHEATSSAQPWLASAPDPRLTKSGMERKKLGRKTNEERQARELEQPPSVIVDSVPEDADEQG